MTNKKELNKFFLSCFNGILRAEETALDLITNAKLTMKEIHFIEAVFNAKERGENISSTIANMLGVTMGTLTASFARLERKGYLTKERCKNDKRVYYIIPTRLAELINKEHAAFHEKMVDSIIEAVPEKQLDGVVLSLKALTIFFEEYRKKHSL